MVCIPCNQFAYCNLKDTIWSYIRLVTKWLEEQKCETVHYYWQSVQSLPGIKLFISQITLKTLKTSLQFFPWRRWQHVTAAYESLATTYWWIKQNWIILCTVIFYTDGVISGGGIFWDSLFKQSVIQMVNKFSFSEEKFIDIQLPWQLHLALKRENKWLFLDSSEINLVWLHRKIAFSL